MLIPSEGSGRWSLTLDGPFRDFNCALFLCFSLLTFSSAAELFLVSLFLSHCFESNTNKLGHDYLVCHILQG